MGLGLVRCSAPDYLHVRFEIHCRIAMLDSRESLGYFRILGGIWRFGVLVLMIDLGVLLCIRLWMDVPTLSRMESIKFLSLGLILSSLYGSSCLSEAPTLPH